MNLLLLIVITLFTTLTLNIIFKKFHISTIVGYILTGAIISFFADLTSFDNESLAHVAEFGIVFLMFTIGLEFSLHHLKAMKKEVFLLGSLQVIFSASVFSFLAYSVFDLNIKSSIIIGLALSLSSTAIVLKVFNESGDIRRPYGRYSLGILLFQDLAVIPILIMISIFANPDASLSNLLMDTALSGITVLVILFLIGKYATERFLRVIVDSKSEEIFISAIMLIVLSSALLAHLFGFSYSLGAFFAGMLIAETKYKYQIEADLVPFRDLLLGLFFISVGLQLNIEIIEENFLTIIGLTIAILLLKAIIIFLVIRVFTFTKRAFKTALALAQVGEFSFAVFALALQDGLIDIEIVQILIAVVVVSLIFTSLVIRYVREFVNFFYSNASELMDEPISQAEITNHIVVCGYSRLGQRVVKQLKKKGLSYIAIEQDRVHVEEAKINNDSVILGNASSKTILDSVNIKDALAVIIAIDNDEKLRLIAEAIHSIDPHISLIVKISHESQLEDLEDLDIHGFIDENDSVAKLLVSKAMRCDL